LTPPMRDALVASTRPAHDAAVDELSAASLPLPLTSLLGRDHDVAVLQQWLADAGARLITLVGPGGVGENRPALELARARAGGGEDAGRGHRIGRHLGSGTCGLRDRRVLRLGGSHGVRFAKASTCRM